MGNLYSKIGMKMKSILTVSRNLWIFFYLLAILAFRMKYLFMCWYICLNSCWETKSINHYHSQNNMNLHNHYLKTCKILLLIISIRYCGAELYQIGPWPNGSNGKCSFGRSFTRVAVVMMVVVVVEVVVVVIMLRIWLRSLWWGDFIE